MKLKDQKGNEVKLQDADTDHLKRICKKSQQFANALTGASAEMLRKDVNDILDELNRRRHVQSL